jgi:hypothetical protein
MKISRRDLVTGASALAIVGPTNASIQKSAPSASSFNGGKTQIQSTNPNVSGDFPFINILKGSSSWQGTINSNSNTYIDPSWLDSNGYPLAAFLDGTHGEVFMGTELPNLNSRPANAAHPLVVTWEGKSSIAIGNIASTKVSGSTSAFFDSASGLWKGRYVWYPQSSGYDVNGNASFQMKASAIASGSYMNNLQLYFLDDEPASLAGEIFGTQYKAILKQSGAGVFRAMDWIGTNNSTTTTWASRKSFGYPSWTDPEWRASLYVGDIMTNSRNNYSLTNGSFTLADKLTMHVHFNADSTFTLNSQSGFPFGSSPQTMTVVLTPAITFTWAFHPFSNGNPVGLLFSGNPPAGMNPAVNYYVVNKTTNTFQLALTPEGAAIAPARLPGKIAAFGLPTLSLNGSNAYPIRGPDGFPLQANISAAFGGGQKIYGTVVFDSVFQSWLLSGATPNSTGLTNVIPIEVVLQLCKELGMHPFFSIPYLAIDQMTDYVPSLATYVKTNGPSWMIPRFEAGNEVWNTAGILGNFVTGRTFVYWGQGVQWPDWLGMTISTVGQAVAAVYGQANLGITYEILGNVQTDGMAYPLANPSLVDPTFTSAKYVAVGPTQAGYTRTAASGWASAVLPATYIDPSMSGKILEVQTAFDYAIAAVGNPAQQAADLNTYVDTLSDTNRGGGHPIPYETARWHGSKDWASRFGVNKMFAYEGGYSANLYLSYQDQSPPFKTIMQSNPESTLPTRATQCVVTVNNGISNANYGLGTQTGNPAVAGMLVAFLGGGMPELANNAGNAVFSPTVPDVTWTAHNLHPNEIVQFSGNLPTNVTVGRRYFVISTGLTTNTFRFSAARGGSAIQPNTTVTGNVFSAYVVVSVAGSATTIDVESSGFAVPTASMYTIYPNSLTYVNVLRVDALLHSTHMQAQITSALNAFAGAGGTFFSQYEVSGTGSIWPPIQPDIYGTQSGELAAYIVYNH